MTMVPSQSRPPPEPGASRPNKTLNRTLSRKISLRRDGSDYGGICCPLIERHYRRPSYTCSTFPYKRHYAFRRKSYILVSLDPSIYSGHLVRWSRSWLERGQASHLTLSFVRTSARSTLVKGAISPKLDLELCENQCQVNPGQRCYLSKALQYQMPTQPD
ncbi:hypothetical protein M8J75_013280 [Diaphorina citri]|nr:hypothetical protein M8J75_013280 [Diaphorina citri]